MATYKKPYAVMRSSLDKVNRDIVYSLCQYGMGNVWEWGREVGGNFWRTAGDVGHAKNGSLWESMAAFGFGQAGMEKSAGPGGWNDPDNILIGRILWKGQLVPTPLTRNEQYTWVSLWSLMAAPLVFGGDMTNMDDFTLSLLTNDELIDINQDPLGKQAFRIYSGQGKEIWAKEMEDGSRAVGLFFTDELVTDYDSARTAAGNGLYARFFRAMLERGIAIAPGPYEVLFPSLAHTGDDVAHTLEVAAEAARDIRG